MEFEWNDGKYSDVDELLDSRPPALSARFRWGEPDYNYDRGEYIISGQIGRVWAKITYEDEDDCRLFIWGVTGFSPITHISSIPQAKKIAAIQIAALVQELLEGSYGRKEEESSDSERKPKPKRKRKRKK